MFVKGSHYVVSDLADLGRHVYLHVQFPLCKCQLLFVYLSVFVLNIAAEDVLHDESLEFENIDTAVSEAW